MLFDSSQGIIGRRKQEFNTGTYLSGIYLYVTNVLFHYIAFYPIMPIAVLAQAIQDRKQCLVLPALQKTCTQTRELFSTTTGTPESITVPEDTKASEVIADHLAIQVKFKNLYEHRHPVKIKTSHVPPVCLIYQQVRALNRTCQTRISFVKFSIYLAGTSMGPKFPITFRKFDSSTRQVT